MGWITFLRQLAHQTTAMTDGPCNVCRVATGERTGELNRAGAALGAPRHASVTPAVLSVPRRACQSQPHRLFRGVVQA